MKAWGRGQVKYIVLTIVIVRNRAKETKRETLQGPARVHIAISMALKNRGSKSQPYHTNHTNSLNKLRK